MERHYYYTQPGSTAQYTVKAWHLENGETIIATIKKTIIKTNNGTATIEMNPKYKTKSVNMFKTISNIRDYSYKNIQELYKNARQEYHDNNI